MPFAILVDGHPVELRPGESFTTYQQLVQDDHEAAWSGVPVGQPVQIEATHFPGVLETWGEPDLARFMVSRFEVPTPPEGKRSTGYDLVVSQSGQISARINVEAISLEEVMAATMAQAAAEFDVRRTSEFSWDFGETEAIDDLGNSVGAAGVQTLQMREQPRDDMKNWLAVLAGATAVPVEVRDDVVIPIKATSNLWIQTTAAQVIQALVTGDGAKKSALQRGVVHLQRFGVLKTIIEAAETRAELTVARNKIGQGWG